MKWTRLAGAMVALISTTSACAPRATTPAQLTSSVVAGEEWFTVVERFPDITPEDSFDLERIEQVLAVVDASALVHVRDAVWEPSAAAADVNAAAPLASCPDGAPLSQFAAAVVVRDGVGNTVLDVARCASGVATEATGVVWNVRGASAVLVTLDGGRYRAPVERLEHGASEARAHDALLRDADVFALAQRGQLPARLASEVRAAREAWLRCSAPSWRLAVSEYEENDARVLDASVKDHRTAEITARYESRVFEECGPQRRGYEVALAAAVGAREIARARLRAKVQARFAH